jgi:hypothetical protein
MGRGRAKAKQTKVARALKYQGPQTDLDRLQAELAGDQDHAEEAEEIDERYAQYYDEDDEDDDEP